MTETATEVRTKQIARPDFRRHRAEYLTALLMREIDDVLNDDQRRAVHGRLLHVLYENGAAWTTEEERAKMGFEPRDPLGWTPSERVEYEQRRQEAMIALATHFVPKQD